MAAITAADLEARKDRLHRLSVGLAKEKYIIRQGNDPLLYLERRAYILALDDAIAGVETARVALAKALQRLDREGESEAA